MPGGSQPSVTMVPADPIPILVSLGSNKIHMAYTYKIYMCMYIKIKAIIFKMKMIMRKGSNLPMELALQCPGPLYCVHLRGGQDEATLTYQTSVS